jgi:CDP-diacylglycerol pyrophosphatase
MSALKRLQRRLARRPRTLAFAAAALALAAVAAYAAANDRLLLWQIAQACDTDSRWTGSPFPCLTVDRSEGMEGGHVIFRPPLLHDTVLVPTRRIAGVESPVLASPEAPNYFDEAWRARSFVTTPGGETPAHDRQLLIVNSGVVRTQDQLHIHIGCLKPEARRRLASVAPGLSVGEWRLVAPFVPHQPFWVLRLGRTDLDGVDPFRLVFDAFDAVVNDPAELTIGVAGVTIEGQGDLVILATYAHAPGSWWPVGAENLLDSRCRAETPSEPQAAAAD